MGQSGSRAWLIAQVEVLPRIDDLFLVDFFCKFKNFGVCITFSCTMDTETDYPCLFLSHIRT